MHTFLTVIPYSSQFLIDKYTVIVYFVSVNGTNIRRNSANILSVFSSLRIDILSPKVL